MKLVYNINEKNVQGFLKKYSEVEKMKHKLDTDNNA